MQYRQILNLLIFELVAFGHFRPKAHTFNKADKKSTITAKSIRTLYKPLQFQEYNFTTKHVKRHTTHARGITERFNSIQAK